MKLLNVRLDDEDARLADTLRKHGVQISRVVRQAIRTEYDQRLGRRGRDERAATTMARIYAELPDPPGLRARAFDLRDRSAVRRAIRVRLRRRGRRR